MLEICPTPPIYTPLPIPLIKSLNIQTPRQPHIPRTRPHAHAKPPRRHNPLLPRRIPITQIPPPQIKRRRPARTRRQFQLGKTPELLGRGSRRRGREHEVQLRDLGAVDAAAVGDGCGDGCHGLPEVGGAAGDGGARGRARGGGGGDFEGGVGEVCVGWEGVSLLWAKGGVGVSEKGGGADLHNPKPNSYRGSMPAASKWR